MDFRTELSKWGYNKGNSIDVEILIDEMLPSLFSKQQSYSEEELQKYIEQELKDLDKGIVATPQTREHLESFAKANNGSMDLLLMQMAIQYGYKIAFENLNEEIINLKK